ncbi:hypothetical protein V8C35DRAFT_137991 [Trichoderma chlorosporum]
MIRKAALSLIKENCHAIRVKKPAKKNNYGRTGNRTPDLSHAVEQLEGCTMLRENYTTKPSAHSLMSAPMQIQYKRAAQYFFGARLN